MNFTSFVFLVAFAVAVDTLGIGVKILEDSINSSQEPIIRNKRTLGVNEELKREVEIKNKDGSSVKISKSITYNDGGALTLLPAVMDSSTNNRIRLLNQIQNGKGRPELANSMINPPSSGIGSFDDAAGGSSDFSEPSQSSGSVSVNEDPTRHIDFGNIFNHPTTTIASIGVEGGSAIDSEVAGESHIGSEPVHVGGGSTHVSGGSTGACCSSAPVVTAPVVSHPVVVSPVVVSPTVTRPIVVSPAISKPVVVNPIITGGVCCGQPQPITTVPVGVVAVNTGHSHVHGLLKKHLEKSIEYHRHKQAYKQHLLDKLTAKRQQISVVSPVQPVHVHTPQCGHPSSFVDLHSQYQGLKELIAYKKEMKAQKHRNKAAAIRAKIIAKQGHYEQKCPSCCCN